MILDYNGVIDLAVGLDRRIIQDGDAQLVVPAQIVPILLNIRPTVISVDSNVIQQGSAFADVGGNQAASTLSRSLDMLNLPKGLYELELTLATKFDFAQVVNLNNPVAIRIAYQSGFARMLCRYPAIGVFNDSAKYRMLFSSPATIQLLFPDTAVAQNIDARAFINAIRVL